MESRLNMYIQQSKSITQKPVSKTKTLLPLGLSLLGGIGGLEAQIIYSGTQNVPCALGGNSNRCYANIDLSGGNDFEFHRNHVGGMNFIQVDDVGGGGFSINGFHAQMAGGYAYPYANLAGVLIGAAGPWGFNAGQANSLSDNGFYPNHKWEPLPNGTTRFMGFKGVHAGTTKYGWMRLTKNSFGNYTIVDWAYENSGNPILTGATISLAADLSLVKSVNDNTPDQNQVVTFTIVLSNAGPNPATNAKVTDVVPTGMTFVVGSQTGPGTYSSTNPPVTGVNWQGLTIPSGGSVVLSFQATVTAAPATSITNFAQVTASAESDPDSTPNNGNIGEDDGDTETLTVNVLCPTASILSVTGPSSICPLGTANLKVMITGGVGPYTVVYTDGSSNFTLLNYVSGTNIPVMPSSTKTYSLISVTDAAMCLGTGNSGAPVVTVLPQATSSVLSVSGPSTICTGGTANLQVAITGGTGPFSVVYSDGTSNFTVPNYISGSNIPVMPAATKTYSLVSVTDLNLCAGTGNSGMPTVTVATNVFSSIADGDYASPSTWAGGCVPPNMILPGMTVNINHLVAHSGTITNNGIINGNITVNGVLKGTGTVTGNVINNGIVKPGN